MKKGCVLARLLLGIFFSMLLQYAFQDCSEGVYIHTSADGRLLDLLYKNYRPVSNLQYVSKLTEKAVFEQIHTHMTTHSLYHEFQSSYCINHSTEMALVRVTNDILMKMNTQEVTLLIMLDLSIAFDTVNHNILLTRLNEELGICGVA